MGYLCFFIQVSAVPDRPTQRAALLWYRAERSSLINCRPSVSPTRWATQLYVWRCLFPLTFLLCTLCTMSWWTSSVWEPRRLYILCWRELSRHRLLPAVSPAAGHLTTPTVAGFPGLCENFRPTTFNSSPILCLLSSHWATSIVRTRVVGVANVGDSLRRLYCLQHRIYNLLGENWRCYAVGHEHPYSIHLHYHRRAAGGTKSMGAVRCGSDSDMRQLLSTLDANCNDNTCRFVLRHRNSLRQMSLGRLLLL